MVVVVVVVVVVIDGSRTEWPAEFYKKEGSPDAIRSEHSGYCSVTHPFSRVPKILYDEYLTDARRILRTTRDFYLVRVLQVSAVPGMYRRPNYKILQLLGIGCIFVQRVVAVYEGSNCQNAAITATTPLCCIFEVFRTESTRRVFRTASTCEFSHYEPIRLFAVLSGIALLTHNYLQHWK